MLRLNVLHMCSFCTPVTWSMLYEKNKNLLVEVREAPLKTLNMQTLSKILVYFKKCVLCAVVIAKIGSAHSTTEWFMRMHCVTGSIRF